VSRDLGHQPLDHPDKGHKGDCLDLTRFDNADGIGCLPTLLGPEQT
jgi:hypothetical protein